MDGRQFRDLVSGERQDWMAYVPGRSWPPWSYPIAVWLPGAILLTPTIGSHAIERPFR